MFGHKLLLIIFWLFWAGTVIIPITGYIGIYEGLLMLEFIIFPIGLCFASATCVRIFPRLAKLGMYSLVITFLLTFAVAFILVHLRAP